MMNDSLRRTRHEQCASVQWQGHIVTVETARGGSRDSYVNGEREVRHDCTGWGDAGDIVIAKRFEIRTSLACCYTCATRNSCSC